MLAMLDESKRAKVGGRKRGGGASIEANVEVIRLLRPYP